MSLIRKPVFLHGQDAGRQNKNRLLIFKNKRDEFN
nr:MAG TPA: hypothetical protein [Caudoviricetes sp.]